MSDNLQLAKECGAKIEEPLPTMHWITFCDDELEAYISRILASQQAAHDAEIARLLAQVAMLRARVSAYVDHDESCAVFRTLTAKCTCGLVDELSNTQATAEQFIAECKFAAIEHYDLLDEYEKAKYRLELRATSKKAG